MSMNDFINTLSKEQRMALLQALQEDSPAISGVPEETRQESIQHINNNFIVDPTKSSNNNRRKEPVKARKNEWVDTGESRDIETKYGERTPRNRKPSKKMEVECSVCGRSFQTDPKYVYGEYHRCSRCTGR
jgi:hypothetical protein